MEIFIVLREELIILGKICFQELAKGFFDRGRDRDRGGYGGGYDQVEAAKPRPAQSDDPRQQTARGRGKQQEPRQHAPILGWYWGPPSGGLDAGGAATPPPLSPAAGLPLRSAEPTVPRPSPSPPSTRRGARGGHTDLRGVQLPDEPGRLARLRHGEERDRSCQSSVVAKGHV